MQDLSAASFHHIQHFTNLTKLNVSTLDGLNEEQSRVLGIFKNLVGLTANILFPQYLSGLVNLEKLRVDSLVQNLSWVKGLKKLRSFMFDCLADIDLGI